MKNNFGQRIGLTPKKDLYTPKVKAEICELRLEGKSCPQVADYLKNKYGFGSRQQVAKYSQHLNVRVVGNRKQGFKRYKPKPKKVEIQALLNSWPVCAG